MTEIKPSALSKALLDRWKPTYNARGTLAGLHGHFTKALEARDAIATRRSELAKDPNLTESGQRAQLKEFAKAQAKTIAKASRALAHARTAHNERRASLTLTTAPDTPAKAAIRAEIRSVIRTMAPLQAMAVASDENADPQIVMALVEAPQILHGLPAPDVGMLKELVLRRTHADKLGALDLESEALELTHIAISDATGVLHDGAGFSRMGNTESLAPTFAAWMLNVAPPDPVAERNEALRAKAIALAEEGKALPETERKLFQNAALGIDHLMGGPSGTLDSAAT